MLRTSSYTIYVDLPTESDEVLLVHGYTGAYNRVKKPVARFLHSLEEAPPKPLHGEWVDEPSSSQLAPIEIARSPSPETVATLKKRGFLTELTVQEEVGHFARLVKKLHARNARPSYIVMPTYDCNLRCAYCFQDHMRTNPAFSHLLRTMTREMADKMFLAFSHVEVAHGAPQDKAVHRRIGFFGGEPLLARNRSIVEYIINKGQSLGPVDFWAVSNATELEAYRDLIGPNGIGMLQITIDGPPIEHDKRRVYADGSGSFAKIAANIDMCLSLGASVSMRMNIDRSNIDQLPTFAESIMERGWDKHSGFSAYTAPITNSSPRISLNELRQQYFTTWELDQALTELRTVHSSVSLIFRPTDQMQSRAHAIFDQRGGGYENLKTSFCGAHSGMYIFDALGDVYACWEKTGDSSIRIGRVQENGEIEVQDAMVKLWRTRTPASNPTCRQCRYAMHCGGGCAVLAEGRNGKIHSNHCDGFADRFRYSVAEAYLAYSSGKRVASQERVCDL